MILRVRRSLDRHDEGASAVEYAVLLAAISALIVGFVFVLGGRVKSAFSSTQSCISVKGSGCTGGPLAGEAGEGGGGGRGGGRG